MSARDPITQLRTAIDCLPVATRRAMLEGIKRQPIIAGAYTDNQGGACPMLAAHRAGSRTRTLHFARAWDTFARARSARRATPREVRILISQLEASLLAEQPVDLAVAIAEHRALVARRAAETPVPLAPERGETLLSSERRRTGEADRRGQVKRRAGWAWLRPARTLDDYQRALVLADAQLALVEAAREAETQLAQPN